MSDLHQKQFQNPDAAREYLEAQVWPNGPVCPHCGGIERNSPLHGKAHRKGLYFCGDCRTQFTVTVGSCFERSKIPLHKWLMAVHLLCSSKKGMSSHQLHRMLGVTYKTAWFMTHRIREAFKPAGTGTLGGGGKIVEADETYYGVRDKERNKKAGHHRHKIVALVQRDGDTRSFHIANVDAATLRPILLGQIDKQTHLMTDGAHFYKPIGKSFKAHESVNHTHGEYARKSSITADLVAHTNTVESFFSLLKRGLYGTYHHVSEAHLQRYCTEFSFRFSHRTALGFTDQQRADVALSRIGGKRLTYRRTNKAANGVIGSAH
jgi:transposase-like protein